MPTSDFSGLASSICALASAVASAAIERLGRCMAHLLRGDGQKVKADRAGFGAPRANAVANCFFGILRDQVIELRLGLLVLKVRLPGVGKDRGKLRPGIG